jgi:hypothetical protein
MYWQDHYKTPAHAVRALQAVQRGQLRMTPGQLHIAHVAARAKLSGISEDPDNLGDVYGLTELPHNLGSLKSFFKKVVKTANKLDPLYSVRKKIDPVTKFVDKTVGITKSSPKMIPATTQVLPDTPAQPIAVLPDLTGNSPMSFAQGSSGGGGGAPAPVPGDPAPVEDTWLTTPVMIGMGAAGLLVLYLLMRKKR